MPNDTSKGRLPAVLVLYNEPASSVGEGAQYRESDDGVMQAVSTVCRTLESLGIAHRSAGVRRIEDISRVLAAGSEPVVFNLVESLAGLPGDLNAVPDVCRSFGREATGCDSESLHLTLDKWRAKAIFAAAGIRVPEGIVVPVGRPFAPGSLPPGTYIVKPCFADASEGIEGADAVHELAAPGLRDAVARIHARFGMPALVERFVDGREFNISLLETGGKPVVLPVAEIDFSAFDATKPRIVDYAAKWKPDSFEYKNTPRVIPAPLAPDVAGALRETALAAWHAMKCRDYARVDMRMDGQGAISVLEVNANPDISPDAGFAAALDAAGIPYSDFIRATISNAARRNAAGIPACQSPVPAGTGPLSAEIRRTAAGDREPILSFIEESGFFRPGEIAIARELLDDAVSKGPTGHYQSFTAEVGGRPAGWVCFGPTPCTVATFDIYWIVVAPACAGRGVGRALMEYAEKLIAERGGRLAVTETSGQALYSSTRAFYARLGYVEQARVPDFYAPGDDKLVYTKLITWISRSEKSNENESRCESGADRIDRISC